LVFLIKNRSPKSVFLIKNPAENLVLLFKKSVFKNQSSLSKIGLQKWVFFIKNQSFYGGCKNSLAAVAFS